MPDSVLRLHIIYDTVQSPKTATRVSDAVNHPQAIKENNITVAYLSPPPKFQENIKIL